MDCDDFRGRHAVCGESGEQVEVCTGDISKTECICVNDSETMNSAQER